MPAARRERLKQLKAELREGAREDEDALNPRLRNALLKPFLVDQAGQRQPSMFNMGNAGRMLFAICGKRSARR
jgi:hypothetical protein